MSGPRPHGTGRTFAVPALIALVTLAGLVPALLGDGWRDQLSWAALSVPVATALFFVLRHAKRRP